MAFTTEVQINYKAVSASVEQYYLHFTGKINKAGRVCDLLKVSHIPDRNRKPGECCCVWHSPLPSLWSQGMGVSFRIRGEHFWPCITAYYVLSLKYLNYLLLPHKILHTLVAKENI